jgi:Uma2 family endonuclease
MIEAQITVTEYEIASAALEASGVHVSLIDGRIVRKVSSTDSHTQIINRLIAYIQMHLIEHELSGVLVSQTTGFQFNETHCPEPDIAYIRDRVLTRGEACISDDWPDFVIEVISDPTRTAELERLERDRVTWLEHGATVYEAWPQDRHVMVFIPDSA